MTADGLTPGTFRPARVGETVSTAAELEALPVGAIVRGRSGMLSRGDGRFGPTWYHHPSRDHAADSATVAEVEGSMTVLFRPDAPRPGSENSAPAVLASDDAVERAARAESERLYGYPESSPRARFQADAFKAGVEWALAAAGLLATPEHDAQVAARALGDAAENYERGIHTDTIPKWLRDLAHDRATRIEAGEPT